MSSLLSPTTPTIKEGRFSATSKRFRESTHLIPTPGEYKKAQRYDPFALWLPVVIGTPLIMLAMAIGLEVALHISQKNEGFRVPPHNVFQLASQQFLLSFFPTIIIIPFAFVWRELDWFLRWFQPYVLLQRGNAKAEESLLMDYVSTGPILSVLYGLKWKHRIIFWSALSAVITYILQPLAGSLFQIQQLPQKDAIPVNGTAQINLNDASIADNTAFLASAGFVQTAVFNQLPDPPFIRTLNGRSWALAEFDIPQYPGFNGSLELNTTAIRTTANCDNPASTPSIGNNANGQLTISATSINSCTVQAPIDRTASAQQYGVINVGNQCSNVTDVRLQPVMFWFYHARSDGNPEARAVFCAPSILPYDVTASANLANGNVTNIVILDDYVVPNNVSGAPQNGQAFNGVIFPLSNDSFIQARANATNNGVPGAIFRQASQDANGLQSVFDKPNGFLDITNQVYSQHLALSAKGVYFIHTLSTITAERTSYVPRLTINALAAHMLAFFLFIIGAIGLPVQIMFRKSRHSLPLATRPGSIAAVVSLTSHSGFGQLLYPYDSAENLEKKLKGLRFRLDQRTGAIVAEDAILEEEEDAKSLLSPQERPASYMDEKSLTSRSSSYVASSDTTTYVNHNQSMGPSPTEYRPFAIPS